MLVISPGRLHPVMLPLYQQSWLGDIRRQGRSEELVSFFLISVIGVDLMPFPTCNLCPLCPLWDCSALWF